MPPHWERFTGCHHDGQLKGEFWSKKGGCLGSHEISRTWQKRRLPEKSCSCSRRVCNQPEFVSGKPELGSRQERSEAKRTLLLSDSVVFDFLQSETLNRGSLKQLSFQQLMFKNNCLLAKITSSSSASISSKRSPPSPCPCCMTPPPTPPPPLPPEIDHLPAA